MSAISDVLISVLRRVLSRALVILQQFTLVLSVSVIWYDPVGSPSTTNLTSEAFCS